MTKFTVTGPDGKQYRGVEAPTADEATRLIQQRLAHAPPDFGSPTNPPQDFGSTPANLAAGFGQGLLDPIEGLGQMAEHLPLVGGAVRAMIPDALRNWAKNYQRRVGASTAGEIGEFAGNVVPWLFQPELAAGRIASTVPRVAARIAERATLPATLQPVPQPGNDFWTQKGEQAAVGTALGAPLEAVAGSAARQQATSQAAAQAAADHASALAAHGTALAAHQTGTLERAAEQQARNQAANTRAGIPGDTTLRWYRETLGRIGLADQAPTAVTPEASARVQKLVGERLNSIIGRMKLDPSDPQFTETLNNIRSDTLRELPESAQTRFYKEPPKPEEEPLLFSQYGRPLRRTTRDREPPKPAGDWVRTVMEPLAKGELSGRDLTNYISRLGARAEELARQARTVPQDQRAELYAASNAMRQVEDAVIGHAAGSSQDKLALEEARKAYSMWSIGNDAGRASQGGSMTPQRLIQTISRRMGEARYKQALADPNHPDRDLYQHLQQQLDALKAPLPGVRPASAVPRHPGKPPTPPRPPAEPQAAHPLAQHAANAAAHMALWHMPGAGHAAYWFGRPILHAIARRAAPSLARASQRVGRAARRAEAPVSAGTANIVKQSDEPDMSYRAPSNFRPPR